MDLNCQRCHLKDTRKQVVWEPARKARIAIVAEAPGPREAEVGRPLVGPSGQKLNQLLALGGIKRNDCWCGNVISCFPPDGTGSFRPPTAEEKKACAPWLDEALAEVQPEIILALGDHALQRFLPKERMKSSHGKVYTLESGIKLVALYHPSYYLRTPGARAMIAQDYADALKSLDGAVTEPAIQWQLLTPTKDSEVEAFISELKGMGLVAYDFETDSLDAISGHIVGISFSNGEKTYYMDTRTITGKRAIELLEPWLADPQYPKVAQNLKFEGKFIRSILSSSKRPFQGCEDTQLMAYLLNKPVGLKDLVLQEFHVRMTHLEDVLGKGKKKRLIQDVPAEEVGAYSAADSYYTYLLVDHLKRQLAPEELRLYQQVDLPLVDVLARMELAGACVDWKALEELDQELSGQIEIATQDTQHAIAQSRLDRRLLPGVDVFRATLAGPWGEPPVNLNAPEQIGQLLFEELKLPPQGFTEKTHQYKTDEEALKAIKDLHPVVSLILKRRELTKAKSTYVDNLREAKHPLTGRVHSEFKATRTRTSRFASGLEEAGGRASINFQNIPKPHKKEDLGSKFRRLFIAPPGWLILRADEGQEELRLGAHLSGDPKMVEVYRKGGDIHMETAIAAFGKRPDFEEHKSDYREKAKVINFGGLLYGGQPATIAASIDLPVAETTAIMNDLYAYYSGIPKWQTAQLRYAMEHGYVRTIFGRRLYIPEALSHDRKALQDAKKLSVNYQDQGSGGETLRVSILALANFLQAQELLSYLWNQVHDEVVMAVYPPELPIVVLAVNKALTPNILKVPLVAEISIGPSWGETKPWKEWFKEHRIAIPEGI